MRLLLSAAILSGEKKKIKMIVIMLCAVTFSQAASVVLDIAPRRQWDNANGYCGETSIQQCGLFYGSYFSQDIVRKAGKSEILFEDNLENATKALSLTTKPYATGYLSNSGYVIPESGMDAYCNWFKTQINNGNPIIYSAVHKTDNYKVSNNSYSHIVLACGYDAPSVSSYAGTDKLIWDDHYASAHLTNTFSDLRTKGKVEWQIFGTVQYAVAVTGIKDDKGVCLPVRLYLDKWNESNVSTGSAAETFNVKIKVMSLKKDYTYAIYRYDDRTKVPGSDFAAQAGAFADTFTAVTDTIMLSDNIKSNGVAVYRCIEISRPVVAIVEAEQRMLPVAALSRISYDPQTNSARFTVNGTVQSVVQVKVFNLSGGEISTGISLRLQNGDAHISFNCNGLENGFYVVQVLTGRKMLTENFIIRR
ncbi:MAG: C39 family peptidase [Chitinispirillaceae bacterium]|jgi:hypothetical protein|nr:C39 family peptidase [Chitinispirillaceae bacterium]